MSPFVLLLIGSIGYGDLSPITPADCRQEPLALLQFGPIFGKSSGPHAPAIAEKPGVPFDGLVPPKTAITKGSFTIWTVPKNPQPSQAYRIFVQVKVPKNLKRYPIQDLSGSITGTDGYKDHFGGPTETGELTVKNQLVRFPVSVVPGAAGKVKDVIRVQSRLLKESCEMELRF